MICHPDHIICSRCPRCESCHSSESTISDYFLVDEAKQTDTIHANIRTFEPKSTEVRRIKANIFRTSNSAPLAESFRNESEQWRTASESERNEHSKHEYKQGGF